MIIREATRKDWKELVNLFREVNDAFKEWAEERFDSYVGMPGRVVFVAEDGKLEGYVGVVLVGDDVRASKFVDLESNLYVSWMGVLEEERNEDVGTLLLKECENYARKIGKKGVWLDCRESVLKFYLGNGYKVIGDYIDDKEKRFVLRKGLG